MIVPVAVQLYQWNVALAAACFEAFHYVEIVMRNAIDRQLAIRARLRAQNPGRDGREQIVAGTDFGFWTELLHGAYENLWREAVHKAFPGSSGRRKDVLTVLEKLRVFRNRLAHHDSLLLVDVPARLDEMYMLLGWIDPAAKRWLECNERITAIYTERPVVAADTVVVPARDARPLYEAVGAYICQPGRSFRPVERIAFYADGEIKAEVPRILDRWDQIDWSEPEAERLAGGAARGRRLSEIISISRELGVPAGRHQVLDLTGPGHPDHRTLSASLPHRARGRGSALVQRQRYSSMAELSRASTTADL